MVSADVRVGDFGGGGLRRGVSDVAFLISDHFKKERTGAKTSYGDVLYSELGGRKLV